MHSTSPRLAVPAHWIIWTVILFVLTFAIGFAVKAAPDLRWFDVDVALNRAHSSLFDQAARLLDSIDKVTVVGGILVVVLVVAGLTTGWLRAIGACVAIGLGWVSTLAVKAIVAEPRPDASHLPHQLNLEAATQSYPSGHVVFTAALVTGLLIVARGVVARTVIAIAGVLLVAAVAWSRLYVGVHYPADVVGGVLNGVAGAILFAGLWNVVFARRSAGRRAA